MIRLTPSLQNLTKLRWENLVEKLAVPQQEKISNFKNDISNLITISDYVFNYFLKSPPTLLEILEQQLYQIDLSNYIKESLTTRINAVQDEEELKTVLRKFRNLVMISIIWQEFSEKIDIEKSVAILSVLAEEIIIKANDWLYDKLVQRYGIPYGEVSNEQQKMLIIGMGKLGGGELNFSSDIDLIFCYPESGTTKNGRKEVENQVFFTKLGQQLINSLHQITSEGQVFRVDMRLRPFGDDGALVVNFSSMEDYYEKHGRSWERYAMVKARILGEETSDSKYLYQMLRPFVYRRYFDFSAIDSLRKMKGMIEAEVRRKGLKNNIKLGKGGIREVEFVTQVFQLIRGGREPELQIKNLANALRELGNNGIITKECQNKLLNSYFYLRRVENILQEINDQQTQTLPNIERDQERIVSVLGYDNWEQFLEILNEHMVDIHSEFNEVVCDQTQDEEEIEQIWGDVWGASLTVEEVQPILSIFPTVKDVELAEKIVAFRKECNKRAIGPQGRETLNNLMPRILDAVVKFDEPVKLFDRISILIRTVFMRTTYLQLLYENHGVLDRVLTLCNASSQIADQFCKYPILLDELIYPENLIEIHNDVHKLRSELRQYLMRVPIDDLEQQMEVLRQFKQIQLLKISASDIFGKLPLMRVSDFLTELAETILVEVTNIAWNELTSKYGVPPYVEQNGGKGFVVAAYGKLGGIELGYGSDLDLVFLHYACGEDEQTNGKKSIFVKLFYVRLVQRIIHLFNIRTSSGILYEIDVRLRPDGDSGLLVSSLPAFEQYQLNEAWTWEHQALVRSRVVLGDKSLTEQFTVIRKKVLSKEREQEKLKTEVKEMRQKMRDHLIRSKQNQFDLKQGCGGMVDIEFLAQYFVLAYAKSYPEILTKWSDNVRIFDSCVECGLLSSVDASMLKHSYIEIRNLAHRCSLRGVSRIVSDDQLIEERNNVVNFWEQIFNI